MKKIMIGLLAVIMTMSICACGNDTNTSSKESKTESSVSASNSSSNKKELIYDSTEAFNYSEVDSGISIIGFTNYDYVEYDKIIVPSEIDGKKVVGIGDDKKDYYVFGAVFGNCEVVIPDTVTSSGLLFSMPSPSLASPQAANENAIIIARSSTDSFFIFFSSDCLNILLH